MRLTPENELAKMIINNRNNLTFDMVFSVYKKLGKWPRVDKVQQKTFVRGLVRGFVSLTLEEKVLASTLASELIDVTIKSFAYLVHLDVNKGLIDVWGPDQQTVSRAMLAVLRIVRK